MFFLSHRLKTTEAKLKFWVGDHRRGSERVLSDLLNWSHSIDYKAPNDGDWAILKEKQRKVLGLVENIESAIHQKG